MYVNSLTAETLDVTGDNRPQSHMRPINEGLTHVSDPAYLVIGTDSDTVDSCGSNAVDMPLHQPGVGTGSSRNEAKPVSTVADAHAIALEHYLALNRHQCDPSSPPAAGGSATFKTQAGYDALLEQVGGEIPRCMKVGGTLPT